MSTFTDVINRLFVFTVGLVCTLLGLFALGLDFSFSPVQQLAQNVEPRKWATIPNSELFLFWVGAAGVIALLLGIFGLVLNSRRHRIRRVASTASSPMGSVDFNLSEVATAIAESFERLPKVIRARPAVFVDHGHRVLSITVDADPTMPLSTLTEHAEQAERDLQEAIRGFDGDVVFKFHLAPVERRSI